jgi:hypothetical protein
MATAYQDSWRGWEWGICQESKREDGGRLATRDTTTAAATETL